MSIVSSLSIPIMDIEEEDLRVSLKRDYIENLLSKLLNHFDSYHRYHISTPENRYLVAASHVYDIMIPYFTQKNNISRLFGRQDWRQILQTKAQVKSFLTFLHSAKAEFVQFHFNITNWISDLQADRKLEATQKWISFLEGSKKRMGDIITIVNEIANFIGSTFYGQTVDSKINLQVVKLISSFVSF